MPAFVGVDLQSTPFDRSDFQSEKILDFLAVCFIAVILGDT